MNKILKSDINKLTAKEKLRLLRLLVDSFPKVEVILGKETALIKSCDIFMNNHNTVTIR